MLNNGAQLEAEVHFCFSFVPKHLFWRSKAAFRMEQMTSLQSIFLTLLLFYCCLLSRPHLKLRLVWLDRCFASSWWLCINVSERRRSL